MITDFILSLLLEKRGDGSFFFCISLFSSWKYFLPAEFYAGCGGNVAEVSRWSFFGDDDLIITFIVFLYDITARGARDVVITKVKSSKLL